MTYTTEPPHKVLEVLLAKDAPANEAQREHILQQVSAGFFQVLASLYFDWEVVYGLYMLPSPLQPEIGNKQCKSNLGLKL